MRVLELIAFGLKVIKTGYEALKDGRTAINETEEAALISEARNVGVKWDKLMGE